MILKYNGQSASSHPGGAGDWIPCWFSVSVTISLPLHSWEDITWMINSQLQYVIRKPKCNSPAQKLKSVLTWPRPQSHTQLHGITATVGCNNSQRGCKCSPMSTSSGEFLFLFHISYKSWETLFYPIHSELSVFLFSMDKFRSGVNEIISAFSTRHQTTPQYSNVQ